MGHLMGQTSIRVINGIQYVGFLTIDMVTELGRMTVFLGKTLLHVFNLPLQPSRISNQVYFIGVKSLFIVCLVGIFTGMVLSLQLYKTLSKFGSEGVLGAAVARSLIMELGPVLASLMVAGRAGSSMAAELGIMRNSEQIDALDTMDINPIKFLVLPCLLASIIAMPLLTAIFDVIGIFGGYLIGVVLLGVDSGGFWNSMISKVDMNDIISGLIKPAVFGFVIAWISCYRGYYCDTLRGGGQGAKGVSLATTSAVVLSCVWILILDYVLTSFLFK